MSEYIPVDDVTGHAVGRFICWPRYDEETARQRLTQLENLGIESLALGGRHVIQGHKVLGKGHVGVVVKAMKDGVEVALKIRRTDADRESMRREAEMLRLANEVGVGPTLHGYSIDLLAMEKITGPYLGEWLKDFRGSPDQMKRVILVILEKTRRLDEAGIDHGELNRVKRHIIVAEEEPRIIDFESASTQRRTQNVTAATQSVFLNKGFASQLEPYLTSPAQKPLISALSAYKRDQTDGNFDKILEVCKLK